jgi:diaminohydroxyphosphoribosylaminopyrimidine deaminase/5-amino-6-(5-phosphoribosylamino)uracil reductase
MELALAQARKALGSTAPNPPVGAVLIRDGSVLGTGYTRPPGGMHAEVAALTALRSAGHDPHGATMYVTLEPCCHHGRTPPCTDAIIAAGIRRVVVGVVDPFPAVAGKGIAQLREAGVDVRVGVLASACRAAMLGFLRVTEGGLPEVTVKAAISLDGHIATASGESQWITGVEARSHAHHLRATHDAILVGIGTALADDPRLTCRVDGGTHPVPVVLDTRGRLPDDARVLRHPRGALVYSAATRTLDGATLVAVPTTAHGVDVRAVLADLGRRGLHRVLVEGGGFVHRSMLEAGVVDHLQVYVAGLVIPGGRPWVGGNALARLGDAHRWGAPEVARAGEDVILHYRREAV